MAKNQDYKTDLYADLRDFDKAVEYVRACAIEGALDIALRDVLAANRLPGPELGSGALREALQKWQRKYFSAGISHEMWPNAVEHAFEAGWQAALSLSSPIEPSLTFEEWWERSGLLGNGPMKPVAMAAWNARPTPQPSSEIRERVEAELTAIRGQYDKDYGKTNWFTAMEYFCKRVADALSPSRQGAGGK